MSAMWTTRPSSAARPTVLPRSGTSERPRKAASNSGVSATVATYRNTSPWRIASPPSALSQSREAVRSRVSSTGCKSNVEALITFSTSLIAVWYSSDSSRSLVLPQFAEQPRVFHRDDRLRREILQQGDLLIGEEPDLLAVDRECAEQRSFPAQRHAENSTKAAKLDTLSDQW